MGDGVVAKVRMEGSFVGIEVDIIAGCLAMEGQRNLNSDVAMLAGGRWFSSKLAQAIMPPTQVDGYVELIVQLVTAIVLQLARCEKSKSGDIGPVDPWSVFRGFACGGWC